MPIINHRYFKSQAFYFKKFNFLNPPSSIKETIPSDRREPSQCLLASLIQSAEGPFQPGSSILVWKGPPSIETPIYSNMRSHRFMPPPAPQRGEGEGKDAEGHWGRSVK
jgi:hypothetical protein